MEVQWWALMAPGVVVTPARQALRSMELPVSCNRGGLSSEDYPCISGLRPDIPTFQGAALKSRDILYY